MPGTYGPLVATLSKTRLIEKNVAPRGYSGRKGSQEYIFPCLLPTCRYLDIHRLVGTGTRIILPTALPVLYSNNGTVRIELSEQKSEHSFDSDQPTQKPKGTY